jgi:hypothetical protein
MKITNGKRSSKIKKLQDTANNCLYVPFYSITDDTLKSILDLIEKKRPSYIRSYPSPLYLLARYRNSHSGYRFSPRHIFTTGSTADWCARLLKANGAREVHFICLTTGNDFARGAYRERDDETFLREL